MKRSNKGDLGQNEVYKGPLILVSVSVCEQILLHVLKIGCMIHRDNMYTVCDSLPTEFQMWQMQIDRLLF